VDTSQQFFDKYELGERVAAGLKGVIHIATEKKSRCQVAVKKPRNSWDVSDHTLLATKCHPNIVRAIECFAGWKETYIVMEWCKDGDLFHHLHSRTKPPEEKWGAQVFEQILAGMRYLHDDFGESHNDIKPENLLLDRSTVNLDDVPRLMLADFGCVALAGSLTQKTGGGDPRYRAPETFWGAPFGFPTDAWASGVVLYEILSLGLLMYTRERNHHGFRAFRRHRDGELCREYMRSLSSGTPVDVRGICGSDAEQLLKSLLELDPHKRATIKGAATHPWIISARAKPSVDEHANEEGSEHLEPPKSPTKKNARGGC
jgi:serine/threonine protein kinase